MDEEELRLIQTFLLEALPDSQAIYLFGSEVSGYADANSDADIGVLLPLAADTLTLWDLSSSLADRLKRDVDLIDLRSASTVFQWQVVSTGRCLWSRASASAFFESRVLSDYLDLNERRAGIMKDIEKTGRVYGR